MGKEDTTAGEGTAVPARTLNALEIQQKEFRVSRFGGYKMRDVDEFLDQITDAFSALTAENERLRAGAAPVVGSPDLDDVSRQADEIIARARAEASRLTGEAKTSAAGGLVAAGGPKDRAAVTAFLTREREFLQSLAGLVQEHAEAVKGMAKPARSAPKEPVRATDAKAAPAVTPSPPERDASERKETEAAPRTVEAVDDDAGPTRLPESDDTVRIEEPAAARSSRGDAEPEGDRSLRELFWGED